MRTASRFITALAVLLTGLTTVPTAAAAAPSGPRACATGKVYVWTNDRTAISPRDGRTRMAYPKAAGTRMCVARSAITSTGYVLATSGGVTAWVDVTTHRTVTGGSTVEARGHVRAAKALAARYGVVLQFAYRDDLGRTGNIRSAAPWLSGTYSGITGKPAAGRGLVRLGTGGVDLSRISLATRSQRRALVMNTVRHELGHAVIERRCGTPWPPVAGGRAEHVAEAYADLYLGAATRSPGHLGYSNKIDRPRAKAIHAGRCR